MISFISSIEIIAVVKKTSRSKAFTLIAASIADAASVYPNGIKAILPNGLSTFFIKDKSIISNGP